MKLVTVVGARPQFIKAAAVTRQLRALPGMQEVLVHTGQHYDANMSAVFFNELEIPRPTYELGIGSGSHGAQTGRMLVAIEEVLLRERPDFVLVYGDTNSTVAGALAATKLHIPVAHVEAGLRSFNRRMPEEINRILTDHAADVLFAPTAAAVENLTREGLRTDQVHLVGDVMYDATLYYASKAARNSHVLQRLGLAAKGYVLATIHRAENTDDPARLHAIFGGLSQIASEFKVVMPLHPRTRKALSDAQMFDTLSCIEFIDPVGYLDMVMLERNAALIATDSGGVQKEAYFYSVPCVTLRDETEWLELVQSGWNRLVMSLDAHEVATRIRELLDAPLLGDRSEELYGGGEAARHIARLLQCAP